MPRFFNLAKAKHSLLVLFILMVPFFLFCQDARSETISGRVTALDNPTGLAGICITAFSDKCNQNKIELPQRETLSISSRSQPVPRSIFLQTVTVFPPQNILNDGMIAAPMVAQSQMHLEIIP
jgi:hypothetical protein